MSIVASTFAAKAKTALTYCCVGALSLGAGQVYERQASKQKARTHTAPTRPVQPAICPSVGAAPLLARGERIDIASSLPDQLSSGFFPAAVVAFPVTAPAVVPAPSEVPEPAAVGLFGLGALAIFWRRRERWRLSHPGRRVET